MYKTQPGAVLFFSQDIMDSLGLGEDEYTIDVRYLIDDGLLRVPSKVSTGRPWPLGVNITLRGIKLVESEFGEQETPRDMQRPLRWKFLVEGKVGEIRLILMRTDVGPLFRIRAWHRGPEMEMADICLTSKGKRREMRKVGQLSLEARPGGKVEVILESEDPELEGGLWDLWEKIKDELAGYTRAWSHLF